jgi:protein-S-isoprenylcysteine O-methyltransferase Ste14
MNIKKIKKDSKLITAMILAGMFAFTLVFLIDLGIAEMHSILVKTFPDYYWQWPTVKESEILAELRPVGYLLCGLMVITILLGIIGQKFIISELGAVSFYLSTFSYFANSMFFLTGVGIFWILWMPIIDVSRDILRVGEIIIVPLVVISVLGGKLLFFWPDAFGVIWNTAAILIQMLGILIFVSGVGSWLYGKFNKMEIIEGGSYNYSRHPQYLGFIMWSYGYYLNISYWKVMGIDIGINSKFPIPSLPWLIPTMVILTIALKEDIQLYKNYKKKDENSQFIEWRKKTPFLLPLPTRIARMLRYPAEKILKKPFPETTKEITLIIGLYSGIIILMSIPLIILFPIDWQNLITF